MKNLFVLFITLIAISCSHAERVEPSIESVEKLIQVTGVRDDFDRTVDEMEEATLKAFDMKNSRYKRFNNFETYSRSVENLIVDFFDENIAWSNYSKDIISIYQQIYTESEIEWAIEFFQSAKGKMWLNKQREIARLLNEVKEEFIREQILELQEKINQLEEPRP